MSENEVIDIGNMCVHCRRDTSFGSGKFINRYPVFGLYNEELKREEDGYCCDDCEQEWYEENNDDYLTNYNNADEHEIYGVNPLDYEK